MTRYHTTTRPAAGRTSPSNAAPIPGFTELINFLQTVANTTPGQAPSVNPKAIQALEASPLGEVYDALKPVLLRLSMAEAAVEAQSPWARTSGNGHNEAVAQLKSLEKKMDGIQKINEERFTAARGDELQATAQALEAKISSYQQDTASVLATTSQSTVQQLATLHDEINAVPDALKHELEIMDRNVSELRAELLEHANARIQRLELENGALKTEVQALQKEVATAGAALIPVMHALDVANSGKFPTLKESQAACMEDLLDERPVEIVNLAVSIQDEGFRLMASCKALFSAVTQPSPATLPEAGTVEEQWASAVESVHGLRAEVKAAHNEAQETQHQLQLFGYLVDQVRDGQYLLDGWAEATNRPGYAAYMDGPFDGFDALQTIAEEMHKLRQANSKLKRKAIPASPSTRTPARSGWSGFL